jgi:hypothetical protein
MIFETGAYFSALEQETFYPKVEVSRKLSQEGSITELMSSCFRVCGRSSLTMLNRKSTIIFRCY